LGGLSKEDRLEMAWIVACGPTFAGRGDVVGYNDGIVDIEVSDEAWLQEMRALKSQLKVDLARISGVKVSELRFIVKK
jgi:hypothetical protein